MTDEELLALKDRVARADTAKQKVNRMREALKTLTNGDVRQLRLIFRDAPACPVQYCNDSDSDSRWRDVCWSREEADLIPDILAAIQTIVTNRLRHYEQELEKV